MGQRGEKTDAQTVSAPSRGPKKTSTENSVRVSASSVDQRDPCIADIPGMRTLIPARNAADLPPSHRLP